MCTSTKHSFAFLCAASFILNISLEAALRKSLPKALALVFTNPLVFFLGFLIILFTFTTVYLFKKRSFFFMLIASLWIVINVVSFCMMLYRITPFNASDLRVLRSVSDIISAYLTGYQFFFVIFFAVVIIALLSFVFIKSGKAKGLFSCTAAIPLIFGIITVISFSSYIKLVIKAQKFDNLPNKFNEHGFVFCFCYSVIDVGIDKPENYSKQVFIQNRDDVISKAPDVQQPDIQQSCSDNDLIKEIYNIVLDNYETMPLNEFYGISPDVAQAVSQHLQESFANSPNLISDNHENHISTFPEDFEHPNIIFVQLESFYDVTNINGYNYSKSPHPIYSLMKQNLPGGKLSVPSIGAGTANTEFEVLTGMDVSLFGIAEYPYLSILQNNTCESIAYNAKDYGYTSHALHNYKGTFYDRHNVFPNLGFDTFTSIENIPHLFINRNNWAKDVSLISPILECLDSTDGHDLVYTISVQPHGKYPSQSTYRDMLGGEDPYIKVTGNSDNPENAGFTYYVNEIYEVDQFIGNLLLELSFRDEPSVLVIFGDHLPSFSVQEYWELKEGNCYQTDYIIWNNCNIDFSDAKDLESFQLSSYLFSKIGISSGDFNILNRLYLENDTDDYAHLRHIYQYAVLYDNDIKNNSGIDIPHYERTDINFGIFDTPVTGIFTIGDTTYVQGENFSTYSKITVNGKNVETEYITSSLITTDKKLSSGDKIGVLQLSNNNTVLGESSNEMNYSGLMVVHNISEVEEKLNEITADINSSPTEAFIHEDATKDFETGADEMAMIQPDISQSQDTNAQGSDN